MTFRTLTALLLLTLVLPAAADDDKPSAQSSTPRVEPIPMPPRAQVQQSIDRGVDFLLKSQNKNGSWGSATRTKGLNIYAPIPGSHHAFRTATTALCIAALIETDTSRPEVVKSIERAEDWLIDQLPRLRRATGVAIYNVWGHAYSIQALVRMHRRTDETAKRQTIVDLIESQIDLLERYESVDGGWGYYDFRYQTKQPSSSSISFVNATGLVALYEAKQIGIEVPERLVKRARAAIVRQQKSDFSYLYGEYLKDRPMRGINRPGGSLGRSQACNVALRLWGDKKITDKVLDTWLHRLFARNGWLDIGRKRPIPHESWFQVAGYFYYYGHYYAAWCIEQLPVKQQGEFQAHMAKLMMSKQEKDGSWWDYPLYDYHQPYGTAFALMTLKRCLPRKESSPLIRGIRNRFAFPH